jgi:hypothetical protein
VYNQLCDLLSIASSKHLHLCFLKSVPEPKGGALKSVNYSSNVDSTVVLDSVLVFTDRLEYSSENRRQGRSRPDALKCSGGKVVVINVGLADRPLKGKWY